MNEQSPIPPQYPTPEQDQEQNRLAFEVDQERKRQEFELRLEKQKAKREKIAITISIGAVVFAALSWMESYETRELTLKTLHTSQRAYIGVRGSYKQDGPLQISIKAFGSSPALNVMYHYDCVMLAGYDPHAHNPSEYGSSVDMDILPTGQVLNPGDEVSVKCPIRPTNKLSLRNINFALGKGTVEYKDIFQEKHSTKFCMVITVKSPDGDLSQCEIGNSSD